MIEFHHVDKFYEASKTEVFKDFSEHIFPGEFVFITGESGSGKSTLMKMLLKDEETDGGKIYVKNKDIGRLTRDDLPFYRRNIGVIFQDFRLVKELDVYENIELARIAVGGSKKDSPTKIGNIMKLLRISDLRKRKPNEMSGGQQQKVCLARALVNNPEILLADEPTANLDPEYSEELLRLFEIIHSQGTTVVIATQDPILIGSEKAREIHLEPSVSRMDTTALFDESPDDIFEYLENKTEDYLNKRQQGKMEKSNERTEPSGE